MPYSVVKALDGRIDVRQPTMVAFEGPASTTFQQVTPPDQTVLNPLFALTVATGMGVNRCMMLTVSGQTTITGTSINLFATQQCIALRAWPIHQMMSNLQMQINDGTLAISPNLYINALAMVGNTNEEQGGIQSSTATAPDLVCGYSSVVGTVASPFANGLDMNQSPNASVRTAQITNVVYNGTTSAIVYWTVSEPLILSPFSYSSDTKKSFFGVSTLNITINYNNTQRCICYATPAGATVSAVSTAFTAQSLQISLVAPTESALTLIPRSILYDYSSIQMIPTTAGGTLSANGGSLQVSSNSIELSVIPSKFIIFACPAFSDTNSVSSCIPDFFFPISNVSCQYGLKSGLLSGASQPQLWDISRRNGVNASYNRWAGSPVWDSASQAAIYGSAPLVLDVAADLGLDTSLSPAMNVRTQFVINCTITNQSSVSYTNARFIVLAVIPGVVELNGGTTLVKLGGITESDLHSARVLDYVADSAVQADKSNAGYAGGMKIKGLHSRPIHVAKSHSPHRSHSPHSHSPRSHSPARGGAKMRGSVRHNLSSSMY